MASAHQLFQAEFGQYFDSVSATSPVGACTKCVALRTRDEVDPQEKCPADLLMVGLDKINDAGDHNWIGFSERDKLETFVKENMPRFRELVEKAQAVIVIQPDED